MRLHFTRDFKVEVFMDELRRSTHPALRAPLQGGDFQAIHNSRDVGWVERM